MTRDANESERTSDKRVKVDASSSLVDIEGDASKDSATNNPTLWGQTKHYYNRFRYYHFVVADKIDMYLSAVCLWILNLYFRLFWAAAEEEPSEFSIQ